MDARAVWSRRVRQGAVLGTSVLALLHALLLLLLLPSSSSSSFFSLLLLLLRAATLALPALSWLLELLLWRAEGRRDFLHHLLALAGLLLAVRAGQTRFVALLLLDAATVLAEQRLSSPRLALASFFAVRLVFYPSVCLTALVTSSSLLMQASWLLWTLFSTHSHLIAFKQRWDYYA